MHILKTENKKIKSGVYLILITVWTLIWFTDDISKRNLLNSNELIIWAIPTLILIYQSIYNKVYIWTALFVLGLLYSLLCFALLFKEILNEPKYFLTDFLMVLIFVLTPILLYIAKPIELNLDKKPVE